MENKEWSFEPTSSEPPAYEPEAYTPDPAFAHTVQAPSFEEPQTFQEPSVYEEPSAFGTEPSEPSFFEPTATPSIEFSSPLISEPEPSAPTFEPTQPASNGSQPQTHSDSPAFSGQYQQKPSRPEVDLVAMLKEQELRLREESLKTIEALKAQDGDDFTPDLGYHYLTQGVGPERYQLNPVLPTKLTDNITDEILFERHEQATAEQNEAYRKLMYLKKQINKDLSWYLSKYRKFSFTASAFKVSVVLLSSIVTVLLGLDYVASEQIHQQILKDIALMMSAMIAVLTGLERFFDAKDLMVQYMKTHDKLEQIKSTIEYIEVGGHYNLSEIENLKLRYDKIIVSTSNFVVEVRADEN